MSCFKNKKKFVSVTKSFLDLDTWKRRKLQLEDRRHVTGVVTSKSKMAAPYINSSGSCSFYCSSALPVFKSVQFNIRRKNIHIMYQ